MLTRLRNLAFGILATLTMSSCAATPTPAHLTIPTYSTAPVDALDYAEKMETCLAASGWESWIGEEETIEARYDEEDSSLFAEDFRHCEQASGAYISPTLSADAQGELYDAYVSTVTCLVELGFDMPPVANFAEFSSAPPGTFFAYRDLPASALSKLAEIEAACPQPEY